MKDTSKPVVAPPEPVITQLPPINHIISEPQVMRNVIMDGKALAVLAAILSSLSQSSEYL